MSQDKWKMFKNFLHNELGIDKGTIREWLQESVKEQAQQQIGNTFDKYDVESVVKKLVEDILVEFDWNGKSLCRRIKE